MKQSFLSQRKQRVSEEAVLSLFFFYIFSSEMDLISPHPNLLELEKTSDQY